MKLQMQCRSSNGVLSRQTWTQIVVSRFLQNILQQSFHAGLLPVESICRLSTLRPCSSRSQSDRRSGSEALSDPKHFLKNFNSKNLSVKSTNLVLHRNMFRIYCDLHCRQIHSCSATVKMASHGPRYISLLRTWSLLLPFLQYRACRQLRAFLSSSNSDNSNIDTTSPILNTPQAEWQTRPRT